MQLKFGSPILSFGFFIFWGGDPSITRTQTAVLHPFLDGLSWNLVYRIACTISSCSPILGTWCSVLAFLFPEWWSKHDQKLKWLYCIHFSMDCLENWYMESHLLYINAAEIWEPNVQFSSFYFQSGDLSMTWASDHIYGWKGIRYIFNCYKCVVWRVYEVKELIGTVPSSCKSCWCLNNSQNTQQSNFYVYGTRNGLGNIPTIKQVQKKTNFIHMYKEKHKTWPASSRHCTISPKITCVKI